ncbi:MAG: hypothetical protein Q9214_004548 [Letrouitia sp. 1 TL-2023]
MAHKRALSNSPVPASKRLVPGKFANPPTINDKEIYIVTEESSGPYLETVKNFREAYATLEDANRMLQIRQKQSDEENWVNEYDTHGCCHSNAEDGEGNVLKIEVERVFVNPPGSVPEVESSSDSENSHTDTITRTVDITKNESF